MYRALTVLLVAWWLLGLAGAAHLASALRPSSDRVVAHVAFLDDAIAQGAGPRMQELFPEGEFFTVGLTALAAGNAALASADPAEKAIATDRLDRAIARLAEPAAAAHFGDIPELQHGTFYRGWLLLLRVTRAELAGTATPDLQTEADALARALVADPTGVPPSYPDQRWPCDAVVAMGAVQRVHALAGQATPQLADWLARLDRLRDPWTGLLPHQIHPDGTPVSGPRGSSQSIIHTFWPQLSPTAAEDWTVFRRLFVVGEVGLVGVREHPSGVSGGGDVDSGPLIRGISLSSSAVTLGAARANGDLELARSLDREAEALGLPFEWAGKRRFAGGLMPVGDAFVAWARSIPAADQAALPPLPTAWGLIALAGLAVAPLGLAPIGYAALRARRRTRPGPPGDQGRRTPATRSQPPRASSTSTRSAR
ncbi:MAG: hypothetical protein Q4G46_14060 [Propionibacteriaceae bacterium]|nr:hypothetical protein [Propionibacteriaceae bacterium]